jgi:hypothetical protein
MSDEDDFRPPLQADPQVAPGDDTWEELGRQLSELGAAIVAAVKAAADDPENRRRAQELKRDFESAARDIGEAFSGVAGAEHGQRVKEAAEAVAAAGRKVADDVRPHLVDATRKAGEALRETASRIERDVPDERPR